jgi:endonuclease YncB( thermonuclease family)
VKILWFQFMLKSSLVALMVSLFLSAPSFAASNPLFTSEGIVKEVYDGNTFKTVSDGGARHYVTLMSTKAPLPGKPYSKEAEQALKRKLLGKKVLIGIYDRVITKRKYPDNPEFEMVSMITLDGKNINREMVAAGLCRVEKFGEYPDINADLVAAENEAKKNKRGIWK